VDNGRVVKQTSESELEGRKRKGRPRLRWLEDDEKDLWGDEIKNCNIRLWTATNGCL
jgi:hypothetical protein